MEFCKALEKAFASAPNDEAREAVQAVMDAHCGNVTAQDGPPTPGGGNGNGPPGGGG